MSMDSGLSQPVSCHQGWVSKSLHRFLRCLTLLKSNSLLVPEKTAAVPNGSCCSLQQHVIDNSKLIALCIFRVGWRCMCLSGLKKNKFEVPYKWFKATPRHTWCHTSVLSLHVRLVISAAGLKQPLVLPPFSLIILLPSLLTTEFDPFNWWSITFCNSLLNRIKTPLIASSFSIKPYHYCMEINTILALRIPL